MFNIAFGEGTAKRQDIPLFSETDRKEVARVRNWLTSRIAASARLPENDLISEVAKITPAAAEYILANHNDGNRRLTENRINNYAKAMREGRWLVHSQGISFSRNGLLNNGQNRLTAIVRAGCPVHLNVSFGEDRDAFSVLDTGKGRTGQDAVEIAGLPYATGQAAAARLYTLIEWQSKGTIASRRVDNDVILETLATVPEIGLTIKESSELSKPKRLGVPIGAMTVALARIKRSTKQPEKLPEFVKHLREGDRITGTLLSLREKLRSGEFGRKLSTNDYRQMAITAAIIYGWNNWAAGKKNKFGWTTEQAFPVAE